MDMASAFQMESVNVKMGTPALTALLVLILSFLNSYSSSQTCSLSVMSNLSSGTIFLLKYMVDKYNKNGM